MSINTHHPLYDQFIENWNLLRDSYKGEGRIKERETKYLPPTSGQIADGLFNFNSVGYKAYSAYKTRAVYYDYVKDGVEHAVGRLHSKPPVVQLPKEMEFFRETATIGGDSLETLLRRIHEQQLVTGRVGLLLDLEVDQETEMVRPYVAIYDAESIINWDDSSKNSTDLNLSLVVLEEQVHERREEFRWEKYTRHRVLKVDDNTYRQELWKTGKKISEVAPMIFGSKSSVIPFVFVNSKDILATPDDPPFLGLARLALTIYRSEADYRQNLFMQGQDTLVIIGPLNEDDAKNARIGSGALIKLPEGSDVKYVGVNSKGLSEQREALLSDRKLAREKSGGLLETNSGNKESGEALRVRVAAQTATLTQIAQSGAFALENLLKICAEWMGENPQEVRIEPNLDFVQERFESRELVEIMTAKNMGAPIAMETVHSILVERGLTKFEYEEEIEKLEDEAPVFGLGEPEPPFSKKDPEDDKEKNTGNFKNEAER